MLSFAQARSLSAVSGRGLELAGLIKFGWATVQAAAMYVYKDDGFYRRYPDIWCVLIVDL